MDIRSLNPAAQYAAARPATEPRVLPNAETAFAALGRDFAATLRESEAISMQAMTGSADPHALVQALAQTELAVEATVTMRNRVVEAYQEILRMPV